MSRSLEGRKSKLVRERRDRRETRIGTYIGGMIAGGILLWVMNKLPDWHIPYLLDSYKNALPAINLSLYVQIAMNIVRIFYHPRFFHHIAEVVTAGFSIFAMATILRVFPVDLSTVPLPEIAPSLNLILRLVLFIGIGGSAIGAVVHLFKSLGLLFRGEVEQ